MDRLDSCDGDPKNGCETNLATTTTSCGSCGATCTNAHGTTSCAASACQPVCGAGYGNCNGVAADGCETSTDTGLTNCGGCGTVCAFTNASATCSLGACALGTCNSGFSNCDGNNANGCEFVGSTCNPPPEATGCTSRSSAGRTYWTCTTARTWLDARAKCRGIGFNLVTINNAVENTFVTSNMGGVASWSGLNDRDDYSVEGTFVWEDREVAAFRSWNSGEPNNSGGAEDCAELGTNGLWSDANCTSTRAYVCEQANTTNAVQVAEGAVASLTCAAGTNIQSYTTLYGPVAVGTCPVSCGTCTIGGTSCSVTYNSANCGDCASGTAKPGTLMLACSHSQTVTVSNTGGVAQTNFQVRLQILSGNTDFWSSLDGGAAATGHDIRIRDSGGGDLKYWIERLDTTAKIAWIWVNLPSVAAPAATATLRLFYGDATLPAASNIATTMIFGDEFTGAAVDTAKWTVVNATGLSVSGGQLHAVSTSGRLQALAGAGGAVTTTTQKAITETRFKVAGGGFNQGIQVNGVYSSAAAFGVMLWQANTVYYYDGSGWVLGPSSTYSTWTRSTIVLAGGTSNTGTMAVWVDGSSPQTYTGSSAYAPSAAPLTIGDRYDGNQNADVGAADWEWILIRKYATTPPTLAASGG